MIIIGAMVVLALPKYTTVIEKVRASEGEQYLYSLLGAQKRYSIDHDDGLGGPDYADTVNDLDIDLSATPSNFKKLTDADINTSNPVAQITRSDSSYTLYISDTGIVSCNCSGVVCSTCKKLSYPDQ